jgi:hypothetical protein
MTIFTIDSENNITAWDDIPAKTAGTQVFTSADEFATLAADWPSARLVKLWNSLSGVVPIWKFRDRTTAARRIWKQIQHLAPTPTPAAPAPQAAHVATKGRKAAIAPPPAADATAGRESSKKALVLDMLRRPDGATLADIMTTTGWQAHTVRGFLSGALTKRMGIAVESWRNVDKVRVYRVGA